MLAGTQAGGRGPGATRPVAQVFSGGSAELHGGAFAWPGAHGRMLALQGARKPSDFGWSKFAVVRRRKRAEMKIADSHALDFLDGIAQLKEAIAQGVATGIG